jgi:hypothetical protein
MWTDELKGLTWPLLSKLLLTGMIVTPVLFKLNALLLYWAAKLNDIIIVIVKTENFIRKFAGKGFMRK